MFRDEILGTLENEVTDVMASLFPVSRLIMSLKQLGELPDWDVESHVQFMDNAEIYTAVLSKPPPQPFYGDKEETKRVIRQYNVASAASADSFGAFAENCEGIYASGDTVKDVKQDVLDVINIIKEEYPGGRQRATLIQPRIRVVLYSETDLCSVRLGNAFLLAMFLYFIQINVFITR